MSTPDEPERGRARADLRRGRPRGDRGGDAPRPAPCSSSARTWPRPATRSRCCWAWCRSSAPSGSSTRPISEPGYAGIGVGAAMTGMRPIVDIMFGDFITLTMDQMVNQAAKAHYMSGGKIKVPIVFRTTLGATRRSAAQHSQSLQAWVSHVPGLKVALPSAPYDAKGLDEDGHPRRQPGGHLRGQDDVPDEGPGARGGLHHPVRRGRRSSARAPTSPSSPPAAWCQVALGAATHARGERHQRRGDRSAHDVRRSTSETLIASAKKTSRALRGGRGLRALRRHRRDRLGDRGRGLLLPRRAGQAHRGHGRAGAVLAGPGRPDGADGEDRVRRRHGRSARASA